MRRQDHGAALDATAHYAIQDAANFGANLFIDGIHDIVDEVELVCFSSSSGVGFHTRLLCLYHVCEPSLHVCVYIFTHIHTKFTESTCMCVCVHVYMYTQ